MLSDRFYMRSAHVGAGSRWNRLPGTWCLLLVNVGVFALQQLTAAALQAHSGLQLERYLALVPAHLLSSRLWELITFQFLHAGWLHLIFNCLALFFFGRAVESVLGPRKFLSFYLACGVVGGLFQALWAYTPFLDQPTTPVVGASAGVFGLVAAYALLNRDAAITVLLYFVVPVTLRARYLLVAEAILALWGMFTGASGVAHAAHLGGMLAALLWTRWFTVGSGPAWLTRLRVRARSRAHTLRELVGARARAQTGSQTAVPTYDSLSDDEFIAREIDPILDKIAAHGIESLTEQERQLLQLARQKISRKH